jgi:GNAT superfamily N-acetyltransferase
MRVCWRPFETTDVAFAASLGNRLYPQHPESPAAFAAKFAATPQACLVATKDGERAGYCVALWAEAGRPPKLDDAGYVAARRETLHLHDLALDPAARGMGLVASALAHLRAVAGGLPLTLIAVHGTGPLWRRHGFADAPANAGVLATYGDDARYMRCNA